MPKIDEYEVGVLNAFEKGQLKSVATKAELAKFKAAARATANGRRNAVSNADCQCSSQVRYWSSHGAIGACRQGPS